jgi:hypothetical protein
MVSPDKFVMGQSADRCGAIADVAVLRPNRKTDLFLCEQHLNDFITHWGLHNKVEVLCKCADDRDWNKADGIDWDDIPSPSVVTKKEESRCSYCGDFAYGNSKRCGPNGCYNCPA